MTLLAWPLQRNRIRRDSISNTFGLVRNGKTKPHQGWDLVAAPMTPCYAVADGEIVLMESHVDLGTYVVLRFMHHGRMLYAAYCHLSRVAVRKGARVPLGGMIGYTGNTGNAESMRGDDQHLHFEIRTAAVLGKGLDGRLDPADIYGSPPIGWEHSEDYRQNGAGSRMGLKVANVSAGRNAR